MFARVAPRFVKSQSRICAGKVCENQKYIEVSVFVFVLSHASQIQINPSNKFLFDLDQVRAQYDESFSWSVPSRQGNHCTPFRSRVSVAVARYLMKIMKYPPNQAPHPPASKSTISVISVKSVPAEVCEKIDNSYIS
ncbi:Hypothetical predicted protein [Cloeon dipterum]|uniref:Uncharacterized protein n=1 Tax=Cloeon dipterum TaxID=197152 RepID=A0A8S1DDI2_9INSE|nr:Hypothetical predicted protein [Cloeon dipterum]